MKAAQAPTPREWFTTRVNDVVAKLGVGGTWIVVLSVFQLAKVAIGLDGVVSSFLFMLTCPGLFVVDLEDLGGYPGRFAVGIAASAAFNIVAVSALLVLGVFSALAVTLVVAAASIAVVWWLRFHRGESVPVIRSNSLEEPTW